MSLVNYFLSLFLLVFVSITQAKAESVAQLPHISVELSSRNEEAHQTGAVVTAHFKLEPGWHIYAQNPGDVGLPTEVQFKNSLYTASPGNWPTPLAFERDGLKSFGYEGELTVPFSLSFKESAKSGEQLPVSAKVSWAVCKDECIPGEAELESLVTVPASSVNDSAQHQGLLIILLMAFLGGIILNCMPCVFPVIALKLMAFVEHGSEKGAWKHGAVFSAGILISLWSLVSLLLGIRAAGDQIGWGFQFQSPTFVSLMALFLFVMGMNMLGAFEWGSSVQRKAGKIGNKATGYRSSFLNGVLVTFLSTPCSAPFMGSAIAAALAMSPFSALFVFSSLGLGLAAPYLLLSSFPAAMKFMPRPGPWMETLKQLLSFPMFVTAAWLTSILIAQIGTSGMLSFLCGLISISFAIWLLRLKPTGKLSKNVRLASLTCSLFLGLVIAVPNPNYLNNAKLESQEQVPWEKYSPELLAQLTQTNQPVLLDFTADWCLTCQVNHRRVFGDKEVVRLLKEGKIRLLRGDWTSRDALVSQAISSFGREGVPLTVLIEKSGNKHIFPSLMSPTEMLNDLSRVSS